VLRDDPELTVRLDQPWPREPLRVVLDTAARTPVGARLIRAGQQRHAIIADGLNAQHERLSDLAGSSTNTV
jgi:diaminohydroxyphosphoribosylaminopyrimidine deaminase/5-amino-6-(5-phosphoribosylamino)uracil reductase